MTKDELLRSKYSSHLTNETNESRAIDSSVDLEKLSGKEPAKSAATSSTAPSDSNAKIDAASHALKIFTRLNAIRQKRVELDREESRLHTELASLFLVAVNSTSA